jgi:hypothetical protein
VKALAVPETPQACIGGHLRLTMLDIGIEYRVWEVKTRYFCLADPLVRGEQDMFNYPRHGCERCVLNYLGSQPSCHTTVVYIHTFGGRGSPHCHTA